MEIGETIVRLRRQKNWSQKDLAAAMEESPQTVDRWEKGKKLPELDRLIHLSQIFEIPLEELMAGHRDLYDLEQRQNPMEEKKKARKDRILLGVKLLGVLLFLILCVIINLVWFKFLLRFAG